MRKYRKSIVGAVVISALALGTILFVGQAGAARERASLDALLNEVEVLKVELEKFERGNLSAGARAQENLQNIRRIAQDMSYSIQKELTGN